MQVVEEAVSTLHGYHVAENFNVDPGDEA